MKLDVISETPEELVMEASYPGDGPFPPVHLHPSQAERFTVLEGTVVARVDGTETRYDAGSVFEVPAGTPHTMRADGPTRTRWEVRPALRTREFFETLLGGKGSPTFVQDFAAEYQLVDG